MRFLNIGVSFFWFFLIVTGVLVQFQVAFFGKVVLLSLPVQKLLFAMLCFSGFLVFEKRKINPAVFASWIACMILISLSFMVGAFNFDGEYSLLIAMFLSSYLVLILLGFVGWLGIDFLNWSERLFIWSAVPLCCIGILQFVLNDPIFFTEDPGGAFEVMSWDFYGQVRGFSLFLSGLDFGYYLAVLGGVSVLYFYQDRKSGFFTIFILCSIAVWCTATRLSLLIYFFGVIGAIFSYWCSRTNKKNYIVFWPFVVLVVGYVLVVVMPVFIADNGISDFVQLDSYYERQFYWEAAFNSWIDSGLLSLIFGGGYSQAAANPGYIVDNVYLNILVQSGLVGLVAILIFSVTFWVCACRSLSSNSSVFFIALIGFYSTFLFSWVINTNQFVYFLFSIPALVELNFKSEDCMSNAY